jgi:hypothetical protein
MQIMSGLRYLNRPLAYNSKDNDKDRDDGDLTGGGGGGSSGNHMGLGGGSGKGGLNRRLSIIHFDLKPGTQYISATSLALPLFILITVCTEPLFFSKHSV